MVIGLPIHNYFLAQVGSEENVPQPRSCSGCATAERMLDISVAELPTGRSYRLQVQTATSSVVQRFVK